MNAVNFFGGNLTANPRIIWLCCRLLAASSASTMTRKEFWSRLAPPMQQAVNGQEVDAFGSSLNIANGVGVLHSDHTVAGTLSLDPDMISSKDDWQDNFSSFIYTLTTYILRDSARAVAAGAEASDLVLGLSWLAERDPRYPVPTRFKELDTELSFWNSGIDQDTKWGAFVRWSRAMSVLRPAGQRFHVDFSDMVRGAIRRGTQSDCVDFLSRLDAELPMHVRAYAVDGSVAPGIAYALLRLEQEGVLELTYQADAQAKAVIEFGDHTRAFTHVSEKA